MATREHGPQQERAIARASTRLDRGPVPAARARPGARTRAALRGGLLRVLRPYSAYQRQIDRELLAALREQEVTITVLREQLERADERLERLELFLGDLTRAVDLLREQIDAERT